MRKADITKQLQSNREHLKRQKELRQDGEVVGKKNEVIAEEIKQANKNHLEKFNENKQQLKKIIDERISVNQHRLNELREGDDEARQRFANEVLSELDGVNDPEKLMQYYDQVNQEGTRLKQDETARVVKNKLWKNGDEVISHNFNEKLLNDLTEKERQLRQELSEAKVIKKEAETAIPQLESYTKETIESGQANEEMEKALLTDFFDQDNIKKRAEEGIIDTF